MTAPSLPIPEKKVRLHVQLQSTIKEQSYNDASTQASPVSSGPGRSNLPLTLSTRQLTTAILTIRPPPNALRLNTITAPLQLPSILPFSSPTRLALCPRSSKQTLPRPGRKTSRCEAHRRRVRRPRMHRLPPARHEMVPRRELRDGPGPHHLRYRGRVRAVLP